MKWIGLALFAGFAFTATATESRDLAKALTQNALIQSKGLNGLAAAITLIDSTMHGTDHVLLGSRLDAEITDAFEHFRRQVYEHTGVYRVDPLPLRRNLADAYDAPDVRRILKLNANVDQFTEAVLTRWKTLGLSHEMAIASRRSGFVAPLMASLILAEPAEGREWTPLERHAFSLEIRRFFEWLSACYPSAFLPNVESFRDLIYLRLPEPIRESIGHNLELLARGEPLSKESRGKLARGYLDGARLNTGARRQAFKIALAVLHGKPIPFIEVCRQIVAAPLLRKLPAIKQLTSRGP